MRAVPLEADFVITAPSGSRFRVAWATMQQPEVQAGKVLKFLHMEGIIVRLKKMSTNWQP